jgi:hypothetical protein
MGKNKRGTPATTNINPPKASSSTASMPVIPRFRSITLCCWILDVLNRSFSVDVEDNITVDHLKYNIVKKNPVSFENVDPNELDLWKVGGFPSLSTYADNFPTRYPL